MLYISNNTKLEILDCELNQLFSLNLSNNPMLRYLDCELNQLNSIDVSNNPLIYRLDCESNLISAIDLSNNLLLSSFDIENNLVYSLDLTKNPITELGCDKNPNLNYLDLRNGNNYNITDFNIKDNPSLFCVNVDDPIWSANNWTVANGSIDSQHYFSTNCTSSSDFFLKNQNIKPLKFDILGRKVNIYNLIK